MIKFRTEINIKKTGLDIGYADRLFFVGSCFSSNIGDRLAKLKFNCIVNPTGVLYNPASIVSMLNRLMENRLFSPSEFFCNSGVWNCLDLHSSFSSLSQEYAVLNANRSISQASSFLKTTTRLFITLGTSWVYRLKQSGQVVANCHKLTPDSFVRERLSVDSIVEMFIPVLQTLFDQNPELRVVFTVSPIRHWKDGAHGNQLSKSTLLLAIDQLTDIFADRVDYFPAYEILMDDLRDYRFYADDLLHPSEAAVSYIFDQFSNSFFSDDVKKQIAQVSSIVSAASHRPFNPDSFDYKLFCSRNLDAIENIRKMIPNIDFSDEVKSFDVSGHDFA